MLWVKKMAMAMKIKLNWFDDVADVIEQKDDLKFLIGSVTLNIWGNLILGCTYFHHVLPAFNGEEYQASFGKYRKMAAAHQHELNKLEKKIRRLHKTYPEISENGLVFDDPEMIDLSIDIKFPIPFLLTDPYESAVLEKITPYISVLGPVHEIELVKE